VPVSSPFSCPPRLRVAKATGAALFAVLVWVAGPAAAVGAGSSAGGHTAGFWATEILSGSSLHHTFRPDGTGPPITAALSNPDDISRLGDDLFVGFQNGVGPQGQANPQGDLDSTVVELALSGQPVAQWDVVGKTDGVTADPATGTVIATVNEDANSSLYTIDPRVASAAAVRHYTYNEALPHFGGTDAISVDDGHLFVSASAPGTTGSPAPQPTYPAVYAVSLDPTTKVATVSPVFDDEAMATVANTTDPEAGHPVALALTDPDSNEVVPVSGPRFPGDFMVTSQGDLEQVYVGDARGTQPRIWVLSLSQPVDDTAWPTDTVGRLYSTDSTDDAVDVITGPFRSAAPMVVATPCGANSAPATCPGPGYPANSLGTLNPWTGQVRAVTVGGATYVPQGGLAFVAGGAG